MTIQEQELIMDALKVIKQICSSFTATPECCDYCPFNISATGSKCLFKANLEPEEWKLNISDHWRAVYE